MAEIKDKAVFLVLKYPYNHVKLDGAVPVGAMCDLQHLPLEIRARLVNRGLMEPTTEGALTLPVPEEIPKPPPKLNKYGLPFGQVPKPKPVSKRKTSKEAK